MLKVVVRERLVRSGGADAPPQRRHRAAIFNKRLAALLFVSCIVHPRPSRGFSGRLILDGLVFRFGRRSHFAMRRRGVSELHSTAPRRGRAKRVHALSSFQRTKAPPACVSGHPAFPATFAFASVTPFRGTFRAYDAEPFRVNPFFEPPKRLPARSARSAAANGSESKPGRRSRQSQALDRRHRVERVSGYYDHHQGVST